MKSIKSVEKTFTILDYIARYPGQKNATEIGKDLAMSPATLHGFLATLEDLFVIYRNDQGKYNLGDRLFRYSLVNDERSSLARLALPLLQKLRDETKETAHLAIPDQNEVLYIQKAESPYPMRLTSLVGTKEKAEDSALGYLFYHLPETTDVKIVDQFCRKYEKDLNAYCLAIQFRYGSQLAGISLVIPASRYQDEALYQKSLQNCAQELISQLSL